MCLTPRRSVWNCLMPHGLAWSVLLMAATGLAAADARPLRSASLETADGGSMCQSIVGWTLYGAPV